MASGVKHQHLILWKDANATTIRSITLAQWASYTLSGAELTAFNTAWDAQQAEEQALIDAGTLTREIITVDADGNSIPACYKLTFTDWDANGSVLDDEDLQPYWQQASAEALDSSWDADYQGVVVTIPGYFEDGTPG